MDIPKFDTLDIPPDIEIISYPEAPYFIFHNMINNSYFRIIIQNEKIIHRICCSNGTLIEMNNINNHHIIGDINQYLWNLSNEKYNLRFTKLELIERIRKLHDDSQIKKVVDYLKINFEDTDHIMDIE